MSMARLRSNLAQHARMVAEGLAAARLGLVSSYDPDTYAVKVKIQPDDVETGWLPIITAGAGNSWGLYSAPMNGDQALVVFQEGDAQIGICLGFLYSDEDRPLSVPAGETWAVHKSGAFVKLTNDGKINSHGPWEHDGTFHATGAITSEADITDHTAADGSGGVSMKAHRDAYNAAKYPGVAAGGASTGTTDHPAT